MLQLFVSDCSTMVKQLTVVPEVKGSILAASCHQEKLLEINYLKLRLDIQQGTDIRHFEVADKNST